MCRIKNNIYSAVLILIFISNSGCTGKVSGHEFIEYVKDEKNGFTKNTTDINGNNWVVTLATKEYMAINTIKRNKPKKMEFEDAVLSFSDMTYFIIKRNGPIGLPDFSCESLFVFNCENNEFKPLVCQSVNSANPAQNEYILGFDPKILDCKTDLCLLAQDPVSSNFEKNACFIISELKELPEIKLY